MNLAVDLSMIAAGAVGVVTFLLPSIRRLLRIDHGVQTIWTVVLGRPTEDGRPAVPGVMQRLDAQDRHLAEQDQRLADIQQQLDALRRHAPGG